MARNDTFLSQSAISERSSAGNICAINNTTMFRPANVLLSLAILSYIIVIGGATYEHLAVVPQWTAAPPASLAMFQGTYGLQAQKFWIPIHPVTLLLMTAALIANWRSPRRKPIVSCMAGYLIVLVITFAHFVPELIALTTTPYAGTIDADLKARAANWETASLVRLAFLNIIASFFLLVLTIPAPLARMVSRN
jgi:hypothetical protein